MTRDQAIREAERIFAALERNADDIHHDVIDWETFETRNRALWDQAEADPRIKSMVLGLLRKDPNWKEWKEPAMSKKRIDEVMTDARIARKKRAKRTVVEVTIKEPPAEIPREVAIEVDPEPKPRKTRLAIVPDEKPEAEPESKVQPTKGKGKPKEKGPKAPKEDLVVFAFRLKVHERDLIHKAAGAAKASRFVRALTVAASMGDEKTVAAIVRAVKEEMAAAS